MRVRLCVHVHIHISRIVRACVCAGCEDVVHWEMPFLADGQRCALFCVFDGHNGVQAANRARELLPEMLQAKLKMQVGCIIQRAEIVGGLYNTTS